MNATRTSWDTTEFALSDVARRIERAVVEREIALRRPRPAVVFVWPSTYPKECQ